MYCLLMFLGINSLFLLKYGLRILPLSVVIMVVLAYSGLIYALIKVSQRLSIRLLVIVAIFLLFTLTVAQCSINPYELNVDRWSAIHNFLYNLFDGQYPYAAQTHLGGYGSPFPVWQVFHIPFYLIGNVGLSFLVGVALFFDSIRRIFGSQQALTALLFLIISPAFVYEIMVRSDLMTNFLVSAAIILYFHYYHITFDKHCLLLSVIIGLMASTRLSILIPFGIYFLKDFVRTGYRRQILSLAIILIVFILTFLPFLLWNGEMLLFFEYNPFVLQSRQGHLVDFLLFIPLGIWMALSWRGYICRYALHTACLMVVLVAVTFVHNMYLNDNWNQLFESAYDITYFDMALPFLIIAINPSDK